MQFVQTDVGEKVEQRIVDLMGGFMPMEMVVKGMLLIATSRDSSLDSRIDVIEIHK